MKRVLYFILIILFTSSASIGKQTQLPKTTKVKRFLKVGNNNPTLRSAESLFKKLPNKKVFKFKKVTLDFS